MLKEMSLQGRRAKRQLCCRPEQSEGPRCFLWIASSLVLLAMTTQFACTKVYRTAKPTEPKLYKKTFAANPNQIYYALRFALKKQGYPIAEEDLKGGVIKTRYVPVKAASHYVAVFGHKDFGVNGAYHQLEVRLLPQEGKTLVEIGSRIQAVLSPVKSSGAEEQMILEGIADYLRLPSVQVTNLGLQE